VVEKLRADKSREAGDGFDGAWVAHPDSVGPAMEEFDRVLGDKPNQIDRKREDVQVTAEQLLDAKSAGGRDEITDEGLHSNCNVGIQYISSWLRGNGAAGIYGLMEDAATAEISRSQVWQWVHHGIVTAERVKQAETEELERIESEVGSEWFAKHGRAEQSRRLFEQVALSDEFVEFLTLPAYEELED
jgi:malate synthase